MQLYVGCPDCRSRRRFTSPRSTTHHAAELRAAQAGWQSKTTTLAHGLMSSTDIFLAGYFIVARSDCRDVLPALPAGLSTGWPRQPCRERSSSYCNSAPAPMHTATRGFTRGPSSLPSAHQAIMQSRRPTGGGGGAGRPRGRTELLAAKKQAATSRKDASPLPGRPARTISIDQTRSTLQRASVFGGTGRL
jgi:hypothetical protein